MEVSMVKSSIKGRIVHCDIRLLEGNKEKMPERERGREKNMLRMLGMKWFN
jgi:hypothetical protein